MGWSGTWHEGKLNTAKEINEYLTSQWDTTKCRVLDATAVVGKGVWYGLIEQLDEDGNGSGTFIAVTLFNKDNLQFWFKELTEFDGPNFVDVPLKFIKKASETNNEFALNWRKRVVEFQTKKAYIAKAKRNGATITIKFQDGRVFDTYYNKTWKRWVDANSPLTYFARGCVVPDNVVM